jgi:hypothetical protein
MQAPRRVPGVTANKMNSEPAGLDSRSPSSCVGVVDHRGGLTIGALLELLNYGIIDRLQPRCLRLHVKVASSPSHPLLTCTEPKGLFRQEPDKVGGQFIDITLLREQARDPFTHRLGNTSVPETHNWHAHRLGFRKHVAECFTHAVTQRNARAAKDTRAFQPGPNCLLILFAEELGLDSEFAVQLL